MVVFFGEYGAKATVVVVAAATLFQFCALMSPHWLEASDTMESMGRYLQPSPMPSLNGHAGLWLVCGGQETATVPGTIRPALCSAGTCCGAPDREFLR